MDAGTALVVAAAVTGAVQLVATLLTRQKLSRIETKADQTHEQVRTSNGRTLAQVAEDTVEDVDQLRGDVMELAIQFARHMGDEHSHAMVQRHRQARRDREETARTVREMAEGDARADRRRAAQRRDTHRPDVLWDDDDPGGTA